MRRGGVLLAAVIAPCLGAVAVGQERTAIVGARVVMPDGKIGDTSAVVIAGGKIERLAKPDQLKDQAGLTLVRYEGAVICPGLIDLCSAVGAFQKNSESSRPIDPSVSAIDAVDPSDPALAASLREGITAVMVTPQPTSVVGGVATTVRTWAGGGGGGSVDALRADGPMMFALGSSVFSTDRGPTSRPGAITLLRDALEDAKAGKGDARLGQVLTGKLDAVVVCEAVEDVEAALRTFGEYKVTPHIAHTSGLVEVGPDLAGTGGAHPVAIAGPYDFTSSARALEGPAALEKAGAEVAFSGGTPLREGASLRLTAALAVRYGLDPAVARRALTATAARVAGVQGRIGSLSPGLDADVVVFSGDPLRVDSRVLAVYVKGVRVYAAPAEGPKQGDSDE